MPPKNSSGQHRKRKKGCPISSPPKSSTVAALFQKQLQHQEQQQQVKTNNTDQGLDDESVVFVREEHSSVYFSTSKKTVRNAATCEPVVEEKRYSHEDGFSATGLKVKRNQLKPKRRLSHRLSLKKGRQEKQNAERQSAEEAENLNNSASVFRDQGDGSEKCSSLSFRSESEGCVSEAVSTWITECNNVSGPSFVQQSKGKGDGHNTSPRCKTISDSTPRKSSSKGKLSLKRRQTSELSPSVGLSSPKAAKVESSTETADNISSRKLAAQDSSSAAPVFSIFRQSAEQAKSPQKKGSRSVTTSTPTLRGHKLTSGDQTESGKSSPVTVNRKKTQEQRKKLAQSKHSGEAITKNAKDALEMEPSFEAIEIGGNASENIEDDSQDVKEEIQYRVPYYLENFSTILKSVFSDDYFVQLFNEEDLRCIENFNNLSEPAQKLYVRLFSRKLAWLPTGKIRYPDIAEHLGPCLDELLTTHLLASGEQLEDLSAILGAMSAPDLRTLAKTYHINPMGQQKRQIIQNLITKSQQSTVASLFGQKIGSLKAAMLKRAKKLLGPVYCLVSEARAVFVRAMMLFSLINTSGDDESGGQTQLFQMLLVNLGQVVYPSYTVNRHTRIFSCRQDLIRFEEALRLESELLGYTAAGNWEAAYSSFLTIKESYEKLEKDSAILEWDRKLPDFLRYYTAGSVLVRLLNQGIEILQRRKEYSEAVALIRQLLAQNIYNEDLHGYWWDRLAINLDVHLKQSEQALQAIQDGLADTLVRTGHRLSLYLRAEAICTKPRSPFSQRLKEFVHEPLADLPKTFVDGRVLPHTLPGSRYQFITNMPTREGDDEVTMCNVEHIVLDHYRVHGFPQGIHAEGSVVTTLFCLFLWDALFMDVVDAFHSPYQTSPLDRHTDAFYQRRQSMIDEQLAAIESSNEETLHAMMAATWEKHNGVLCAGINWERFSSVTEAQGLVSCMGGSVLSGILRRYAEQPRHTGSGFPDLTLWNTSTKQLKICEVKGPGDRLSHKQMMWLDYLLKLGVDAEVCHVKPVGVKKLKPATKPELDGQI